MEEAEKEKHEAIMMLAGIALPGVIMKASMMDTEKTLAARAWYIAEELYNVAQQKKDEAILKSKLDEN